MTTHLPPTQPHTRSEVFPGTATGSAHGKIILIGEHAVVYNQPAIALPFNAVTSTAIISTLPTGLELELDCAFYSGPYSTIPAELNHIKQAILSSLTYLLQVPDLKPVKLPALRITLQSTIPAARGMGSSAAISVAIIRALFAYYQSELAHPLLSKLVQTSERVAHGNPSGIDAATTSGDTPIYFIKDRLIEPLQLHTPAYVIVADTGIKGRTLEAVEAVQALLKQEQTHAKQLDFSPAKNLQELGQLTDQVKRALHQNDLTTVGTCLTMAHLLLQQLDVSHVSLDQLVAVALKNGALGAKLTGGGRGGCMLALAPDRSTADQIAQALQQAGATQTWIQPLL